MLTSDDWKEANSSYETYCKNQDRKQTIERKLMKDVNNRSNLHPEEEKKGIASHILNESIAVLSWGIRKDVENENKEKLINIFLYPNSPPKTMLYIFDHLNDFGYHPSSITQVRFNMKSFINEHELDKENLLCKSDNFLCDEELAPSESVTQASKAEPITAQVIVQNLTEQNLTTSNITNALQNQQGLNTQETLPAVVQQPSNDNFLSEKKEPLEPIIEFPFLLRGKEENCFTQEKLLQYGLETIKEVVREGLISAPELGAALGTYLTYWQQPPSYANNRSVLFTPKNQLSPPQSDHLYNNRPREVSPVRSK
jgi:hypothetical protein